MAIFFFSPPGNKALTAPSTGQEGDSQHHKTPACRAGAPHVPVPGLGSLHQQPQGVDDMGVRCKKPAHQLPWGWDTRASHPLVPKQRGPGQPGLRNRGNFLRKR